VLVVARRGAPDLLPTMARALIAYAAPQTNAVIGACELGRSSTLTFRLGSDHLQAEVVGSGLIWLRVAELSGLAAIPGLATATTAAPASREVVVVEAPVGGETYQPGAAATLAPPLPPGSEPQLLSLPAPTPWDSEAARQAERKDEEHALSSVDDPTPSVAP
jgi:hypothetical protein